MSMQAPNSPSPTNHAEQVHASVPRSASLPTWLAIASVAAAMACFRLLGWEHHYVAAALSAGLSAALFASTFRLAASMGRHLLRVTAITTLLLTAVACWTWYSNHYPADVQPVASSAAY